MQLQVIAAFLAKLGIFPKYLFAFSRDKKHRFWTLLSCLWKVLQRIKREQLKIEADQIVKLIQTWAFLILYQAHPWPEFILFRILIKWGSHLLNLDYSRLEYIWYGCSHLLFSRRLCFMSYSIYSHSWEFSSYSHKPDPGWGRTQAISLFLQSLCHVLLTLVWTIGMEIACILNIQHSFPLSLVRTGSRAGVSGDGITPFLRNQHRNSAMRSNEDNRNNLMLWFLLWRSS